ncbi:MAG: hypothetical protein WD468_12310 [Pirellulales bacterium]
MAERLPKLICSSAAMLMVGVLVGCESSLTAPLSALDAEIDQPEQSNRSARASTSRIRLSAATVFFVSPTGNDDASGLSDITPWHTLQHAYDTVSQNYDLAGFPATIRLADGTYGEEAGEDNVVFCDGRILGQVGPIRFVGNPAHPENVIISATSNNIFEIIATWAYIDGMTLTGTGSTVGLLSYFDARITFANIIFGPMGEGIHQSAAGGIIIPFSDYKITGGAGYHLLSQTPGSRIDIDRKTITLSGTPKFSAVFAVAQNLAMISANGNTFAGTGATGTRYLVRNNGIIQTSGDGDYFPGDAAGSVATGGQYGP